MRLEKDDAKIGLLVFLALALFVGVIFQRSLTTLFRKVARVQVRLENAADVAVGTEVQLQGLRVGQVDDVHLRRDCVQYHFLATLGLRTDIVLWEGTRVVVVAKPLGSAFLDLQLPPPEARLEILRPGTVLPASASPSLGTLVDAITALATNLNKGVDELRAQFRQKGMGAVLDHPGVSQALRSLDESLQSVRQLSDESRKLVQDGRGSVRALDQTLEGVQQTLAQVQGLVTAGQGDLETVTSHLAGTLTQLEGLAKEIREVLAEAGPDADESIKSLDRTLRTTEELLELLKTRPRWVVWGKPSQEERDAAAAKVEAARKAQGAKP
jgi:ABC-type transporter Mla subunit MlaD